jgi:hypothetical protein
LNDLAASASATEAHNDQALLSKLQEASQRMAYLTYHLIGNAGKKYAVQVLCLKDVKKNSTKSSFRLYAVSQNKQLRQPLA